MQTIKILIYTDLNNPEDPSKNITLEPSDPFVSDLGLSMMRDLILRNKRPLTDIRIDFLNRNIPTPGSQRLTSQLLSGYHQLWVFGFYQIDMNSHTPETGGPDNELKDEEVEALRCWMNINKGGVLITGDHAEEAPLGAKDPPALLLSLGRALAHRIPRAGEMRAWEGPPAATGESYNTQTPTGAIELDNLSLQSDAEPQHIFLRLYENQGGDVPHELFQGGPSKRIQVFPDHMHEGKLVIPCPVGDDWPAGSPTPEFLAWGADYRFFPPRFYPLVSVYDGHKVEVGRIVADSSWHHYMNVNLRSLPGKSACSCSTTAPLEQIGNYFRNLVVWLAPKEVQREMNTNMLKYLASHPQVLEVATSDPVTIGKTAVFILEQKSLSHELDALLKAVLPKELSSEQNTSVMIPRDLLLGSMLKSFINKQRAKSNAAEPELMEAATADELISEGVRRAFAIHLEQVEKQAAILRGFNETPTESNPADDRGARPDDLDRDE